MGRDVFLFPNYDVQQQVVHAVCKAMAGFWRRPDPMDSTLWMEGTFYLFRGGGLVVVCLADGQVE